MKPCIRIQEFRARHRRGGALRCRDRSGQAQFYKGKTLNVLINYGAGGNTDIQGRSVLRFMENYIEGKPRTVVRNMGGAGGIVGTNYLGRDVRPDGSMMGIFTIAFMGELLADPALTVSHRDFIYIGAIGQSTIAHIRKDVSPGIEKPTDIFKVTEPFRSAGHAPSSQKDIRIKLTLDLLGVPHQHVTGMKDAGVIRRAILQNNIQFTEDSLTGYYAGVQPTLIEPGISIPLWHMGVPTGAAGWRSRARSNPRFRRCSIYTVPSTATTRCPPASGGRPTGR
jgi:tripartite-type tricarboxylate transporter receptor subunit TctC